MLNVLVGPLRRGNGALDRGILGWQAKGVPAHRLQNVASQHSLITADDIADGVIAHVPHVQLARWVGQHGQTIVLLAIWVFCDLKTVLFQPPGLDSRFQLLR